VLDPNYGFPFKPGGIVEDMNFWSPSTVEDHIQPIVAREPLRRLVLIGSEPNLADSCATLHFYEANFGEGLVVPLVSAELIGAVSRMLTLPLLPAVVCTSTV